MTLTSGMVLVDKPRGPTSHDVVDRLRRVAGLRRVGHAGTLDPFASGLLIVLLGPATRLSEYFLEMDKAYVAVARLGVETTTHDLEGEVVEQSAGWQQLAEERIREALLGFLGVTLQQPPAYSAKKIRGESAHRRVRRGESVELEPVEVEIAELELLDLRLPELRFRIRCSSGTYIRALARDLGRRLGVGAHLTELRRTAIGPHGVESAVPLEELGGEASFLDALAPPSRLLPHLPSVEVGAEEAAMVRQGRFLSLVGRELAGRELAEGEPVRILYGRELLAMGLRRGGEIRPRKVLAHD